MLHNTAQNINLAPLTFWSNHWGVLYILVLGLLHHLTDAEVENVFETAQKHMDRNSVLITIDPIVHEKTSLAARYLISKDRGKAIRSTEQIFELATLRFSKIEFDLRNDLNNFPWSHVIMKASL